MKTTFDGGSSSVLSSALNASLVSIWTSSMTYTLYLPPTGARRTRSRSVRISSMPRLDAASISMTSTPSPRAMLTQAGHSPHGSPATALGQLRALASTRAVVVFPVPRGPQNKYACERRSSLSALSRVRETCSCPTISANVRGRYSRYKATGTCINSGNKVRGGPRRSLEDKGKRNSVVHPPSTQSPGRYRGSRLRPG